VSDQTNNKIKQRKLYFIFSSLYYFWYIF